MSEKTQVQPQSDPAEALIVAEALAQRAACVKRVADWARTRLDRAAALANLATEPGRPDEPPFLRDSADALLLAERLLEDVNDLLDRAEECGEVPDLLCLLEQAFDREKHAVPESAGALAGGNVWRPDYVARLTVGELRARLSLTDQAGGRAAAETPAAAAR